MDFYFTKAKPKLLDYNPITHTSFYNQPSSPQLKKTPESKLQIVSYHNTSPHAQRPTSIVAKNLFSSPNPPKRSPSLLMTTEDNPRYYKTRAKSKIVDPISGEVKVFSVERPKIDGLDVNSLRDRLRNDLDFDSFQKFSELRSKNKSTDNIAGSLRKEVPFVSYVNPFVLKKSINS